MEKIISMQDVRYVSFFAEKNALSAKVHVISAACDAIAVKISATVFYIFSASSFFVSFFTFFLHFPQPFPALVIFFTSLKEEAPFSTASAISPFVTL